MNGSDNDKLIQAIAISIEFCNKNGFESFVKYMNKFYNDNHFEFDVICQAYNISQEQLFNKKITSSNVVNARRTVMYILKSRKNYDTNKIAAMFAMNTENVRRRLSDVKAYLSNKNLNPFFSEKYNLIITKLKENE